MKKKIYKLGELFCGPGGIALGAISAKVPGMKIVHQWANDFDSDTCQTYTANICPKDPESVHCIDVRQLDMDALTPINALAFGFPCNDYSLVGKRKGMEGEYGPLYTYGVKALKKFSPDWFLAENVSGLRADKTAFRQIMKEFYNCGYDLYPHMYNFEEYGIPQMRHRVIIVGIQRDKFGDLKFQIPSTNGYKLKISREAIENPPIPEDAKNNERTKNSYIVQKRLEYIGPGKNVFNSDIPEEYNLHIKGAKLSQIYRRLDPDKPSYTVTGSGGGGTHIYHWKENRALTNRERARLQTFPDDFVFYGSNEKVRRQIGMAVPVLGAKIIFEAILKTFAGIPYEAMSSNIPDSEWKTW